MEIEISKMTETELNAAIRVLGYQVNAKLFIGNRSEREQVLRYLKEERERRG